MARRDSSKWLCASKIWKALGNGSEWLSASKIDSALMPSAMAVNGPVQTKKGSALARWQQWPQRNKQQSKLVSIAAGWQRMAQREYHQSSFVHYLSPKRKKNKHGAPLKRGAVGKNYDLDLSLLSE